MPFLGRGWPQNRHQTSTSVAPTDLGGFSRCGLWLDASALTDANNALLTTMPDRSGNGRTATSVATFEPRVFTNVLGGNRVVRFSASRLASTYAGVPGAGARTMVLLVTNISFLGANFEHMVHYGANTAGGWAYGLTARTSNVSVFGNHYWVSVLSGPSSTVAGPHILIISYDGTTDRLYVDDPVTVAGSAVIALTTGATTPVRLGCSVAATEPSNFDLCEFAFYDRVLTAAERTQVVNLLTAKWLTPTAVTYTKTGGGCGSGGAASGAKTVVSPLGATFIEDVNAVVGTTTVTTGTFVAAPAVGDLAYCYAVNKPSTITPPDPAGWTSLSSVAVGTGVDGVGTGLVRITVWYQIVAGAFTPPTVTNPAGSVIAAGIAYLHPTPSSPGTATVDHATTSAQDLVDDTTWSLTGAADVGVIAQDLVLTVDGWSNNISGAASGGTLTGPGITAGSSSELTDTQLNVGNRGQMVANLFWGITGQSSGAQTHAQTLNAAMTNRTGGTLFVRIRALGQRVAQTYAKTGGGSGSGAAGSGAKTVVIAPVTLVNNLEGGTSGVTITGANAGGAGNNLFDAVSRQAAATLAFDNAVAAHGALSAKMATSTTAGAGAGVRWDTSLGIQGTIYARLYLYVTGNPTAATRIFTAATTGAATLCGGLYLMTDGTLELDGPVGLLAFTTNTVNLNGWTRIELRVDGSMTAGYGELRLYKTMDSATATETKTSGATMNTGGPIALVDFGHSFATLANVGPFWLDDLGLSNVDWLGPVVGGVVSTKTGGGVAAGAGSGPKVVTPATAYVKTGGAISAGAGSGAKVYTPPVTSVKTGGAITAGAGVGTPDVVRVETGGAIAAGAGSGAKVYTPPLTSVKTGGAITAGAGSAAKVYAPPLISVKTGGAIAAGAGSGAKTVAGVAAIVKTGGAITAGLGVGTPDVVRVETASASAGTAGSGAKVYAPPLTSVKTGGAAASGAGSGAKVYTPAVTSVKTGGAAASGAGSGAKVYAPPLTSLKTGGAAATGAGSGAKVYTPAVTSAKTGAGVTAGAASGAKIATGTATTYVKTGGAAASALGSGPEVHTYVETGGGAAGGASSGPQVSTHVETASGAAGTAGSGAKTVSSAGQIVKTGGAIAAGAGVGTPDVTRVKTGDAIAGTAGSGPKTVSGAGQVVKTGGAAAAGLGVGTPDVVRVETASASAGTAGSGAKTVSSSATTYVKTGAAISSGAASGAKVYAPPLTYVKTADAAASGAGSGAKVYAPPLTSVKTVDAAAAGAGSGPKTVSGAGQVVKTGGAAAVGLGSGAKAVTLVGTGGASSSGAGSGAKTVSSAGAIVKTGAAVETAAAVGTPDVVRVKTGGGATLGAGSGSRAVDRVETGAGGAGLAAAGSKTTAGAGQAVKTGGGLAGAAGSGPRQAVLVRTASSAAAAVGSVARVRERYGRTGGATSSTAAVASRVRELRGRTGGSAPAYVASGPRTRVLPRGGAGATRTAGAGPRTLTRPRAGSAAYVGLGSVNRDKGLRIVRPYAGQTGRGDTGRIPRGVAGDVTRPSTARIPRVAAGTTVRPTGPAHR